MTISYNVGLAKMGQILLEKMGKLVEVDNLIGTETENRDDINIILPFDSPELGATPVSLKAVNAEKEKKLENSSSNKTFKIKINKEHYKIEEDLFLSPKEWGVFTTIIFKSVFELAPSIKEFNNYLNKFMAYFCKILYLLFLSLLQVWKSNML